MTFTCLKVLYSEQMYVSERCKTDDQPGDIPNAYICQLTMDVFRDPVMTPSGLSYERSALMEHMQKVLPLLKHNQFAMIVRNQSNQANMNVVWELCRLAALIPCHERLLATAKLFPISGLGLLPSNSWMTTLGRGKSACSKQTLTPCRKSIISSMPLIDTMQIKFLCIDKGT